MCSRVVAIIESVVSPESLTCEHCGHLPQNWAAARYQKARLCTVVSRCRSRQRRLRALDVLAARDSGFEPNPDWANLRGRVATSLMTAASEENERGEERRALRLKRKAIRFANCGQLGRSAVCSEYPFEHKFYVPHDCATDFVGKCAQSERHSLFEKHLRVVLNAMGGGIPKDRMLARVTFSLRSDGSAITPDRVKQFNQAVRFTIRKSIGSRDGYGFLFCDEVGFEKRGHLPDVPRVVHGLNLHCHGLYFGPYVDWERTRDLWKMETAKRFNEPSTGFFITQVKRFKRDPERAARWALNHLLKYLSKPPAGHSP